MSQENRAEADVESMVEPPAAGPLAAQGSTRPGISGSRGQSGADGASAVLDDSRVPEYSAGPRMGKGPSRGVRSGPVAAALATAAILAATALPGPPKFTPTPPPAPVMRALNSGPIASLGRVGTLRLGGSLADFEMHAGGVDGDPNWLEREDGSASFSVRLVSLDDPATALEGLMSLTGVRSEVALDPATQQLFAATVPGIEGVDPRLERVEPAEGVRLYGSISGMLVGEGELGGVAISVRNVPGTLVRRGPWSATVDGASVAHADTLFGRLVWLREEGECAMELEDHGRGTLGLSVGADLGSDG